MQKYKKKKNLKKRTKMKPKTQQEKIKKRKKLRKMKIKMALHQFNSEKINKNVMMSSISISEKNFKKSTKVH